jgi:phage-related minor tail protein
MSVIKSVSEQNKIDNDLIRRMEELESKIKQLQNKLPYRKIPSSPVCDQSAKIKEENDYSEYRHLDLRY